MEIMWHGNYNFFDYKGNIAGYTGQDYMAPIQFIMSGIAFAAIIALLIVFRNAKKENSKKFFLILGIFMTFMYLAKTTWESYYDITQGDGFNIWILPFDTCSLIMPALIIAGLSKKDSILEMFGVTFASTIGFAGGISNMIFLRGLKFYPMFSFGGLYSYFWHVNMIFVAFYIPVTRFHEFKWIDILNGMVVLLAASLIIIPLNYIKGLDFALLNGAGGVPLVEDLAAWLIGKGLRPLATLAMFAAYLLANALMVSIYIGYQKTVSIVKSRKLVRQN